MQNSYTNAKLRTITYTAKKRSATHLATAAKLFTWMPLIKHYFLPRIASYSHTCSAAERSLIIVIAGVLCTPARTN